MVLHAFIGCLLRRVVHEIEWQISIQVKHLRTVQDIIVCSISLFSEYGSYHFSFIPTSKQSTKDSWSENISQGSESWQPLQLTSLKALSAIFWHFKYIIIYIFHLLTSLKAQKYMCIIFNTIFHSYIDDRPVVFHLFQKHPQN